MTTNRHEARLRRHRRVRTKVRGSAEVPRLAVFRSNRHVYAQLIDDAGGRTLAAASTLEPAVRVELRGSPSEVAAGVGRLVARRAIEAGITAAVFDRGGFRYHGKVKALADAAREQGLRV